MFYSQHNQGPAFVTQTTAVVWVTATWISLLWSISVSWFFFWRTSEQNKDLQHTDQCFHSDIAKKGQDAAFDVGPFLL